MKKLRVLLVDDEIMIREGFKRLFDWEAHDCEVVGEAADGMEALAQIDTLRPDIVIMDINIPIMSGLKVIQLSRIKHPQIAYVIVSGYDDFSYCQQALRLQITDYILKPVNYEEFGTCIDNLKISLFEQRIATAEEPKEQEERVITGITRYLQEHLAEEVSLSVLGEEVSLSVLAEEFHLNTIQKAFKIFMILSRIAMILSFIWAGVTLAGTFCAIAWYCGGTVMGMNQETLLSFPLHVAPNQMLGVLLSEMIFALTNGVLLLFAFRYFKAEQEDGTPFTHSGADQIKCLGIQTIAMLFVAAILASLVFEGFDLYSAPVVEWDNMTGVALGIVMILASFVFRYGAELEESCAYDISVGSLWNMAAKESCGKEQ